MSTEEAFDFPTTVKLLAGAMVGILIGGSLGAAFLISQPVREVTDLPDNPQPAVHYVLKGRISGGDAWKYKATELQSGKEEVVFLETEMNRWASSFTTAYAKEKPSLYLEPQNPVFRLDGDRLLVSSTADSGLGDWTKTLTLSLEGGFVTQDGIVQMVPEKLFVGSLRLPGPAKNFVWKRLSSAYTLNEEFQSLWSSIESANVQESQLILLARK